MATSQFSEFLQRLRTSMLLRDDAGLTDGKLLERFLEERDDAAFAALVRKHGPMVWGGCRRHLNPDDAEDAFQATFLVLVRRAAAVVPREMVANWLYGVAHQTALKARATIAKRRGRERQVTEMPEQTVPEPDAWKDLRPLLDQELSRLPDKYRAVIVLCDLEGKTRKEAAQQLRCPEGTVATRLLRGRAMLAKRLTRQGLTLTSAGLATLVSGNAASACVPTLVLSSTIKAATLLGAGQVASAGAISTEVAALMEGVLKAMWFTKIKVITCVLLAVGVITAGGSGVGLFVLAGEQPKTVTALVSSNRANGKAGSKPKPVIVREEAMLHRLAWSPDSKLVATVGLTNDPIEGKENDENILNRFSPNSTIKLWNAKTGKLKRSLVKEENAQINGLAFSPDGKTVAIALVKRLGRGGWEVRLADAENWQIDRKVDGDGWVAAIAFSPDGKKLAFGGNNVGNSSFLRLWDVEKGKPLKEPEDVKVDGEQVNCLTYSPDGKLLAAHDRDRKIRLFDIHTGEQKALLDADTEITGGIAFSSDGKSLLTGSSDKTVQLWDVNAAKLLRTFEGNKGIVHVVAFSKDGKFFATGGGAITHGKGVGEVIVWEAKTGRMKPVVLDHTLSVSTLSFSPDSKTLAIGCGGLIDGDKGTTSGALTLVPVETLVSKEN